ncbi:MAG: hypothetical protein V3S32_06870 [Acidimicrobiia bacterium]
MRWLLVWCGTTAAVGAILWVYKGVAIIITGNQPDHAFQVAPFFFGVSVVTLVYSLVSALRRPRWLLVGLGWLAVVAGATAAIAHFAQNEDGLGDPAYLVNFLSTILVFFLIGGDTRRKGLLPKWSSTPTFLAWALLAVIPFGAVLEGIDERLIEVPLLVASVGWAMLAVAAFSSPPPDAIVQTQHS